MKLHSENINMLRLFFLVFFIFYSVCSFSQTVIKATVKDSKTKEPLDFSNVAIKGTKKGTITNSEGVFSISVDITKDILIISYLGYENKTISAEELLQKPQILLVKKGYVLQEVSVHSDNDYLYDIMGKCRERLIKNNTSNTAKVYYGMETESKTLSMEYQESKGSAIINNVPEEQKEEPVELLECFYNGYFKGINLQELRFKNGRTALAAKDNYFLTLNSSKAISKVLLVDKNKDFPVIPFQCNDNNMKRLFNIEQQYSDDNSYNIKFYPKNDNKECFSGEVWIEKKTFNLLKIILRVENTEVHPFLPLFPFDTISNVSLNITNTYKNIEDKIIPDHINFNYSFSYSSRRDTLTTALFKTIKREIKSKGVMYFYDYNQPFILPYFNYSNDFNDYNKMSFIPYNNIFWINNNSLIQTEKQKENFGFLLKNGKLINYNEGMYGKDFLTTLPELEMKQFFEFFYAFWSSNKRLIPNLKSPQFKPYSKDIINKSILTDLYQLKVQLLLDVTESNDSLICKSYTVFDNELTFYHLPTDSNTNAFINIYFDICEIERMKMHNKLNSKNYTASQIDSIYKETIINMDNIANKYLKEVNLGENDKFFRQWNKYVFDNLSIDNIKMVEESNK